MTEQSIPLEELQPWINAIDSGISILEFNGGTLLFNSRMEKMIGYTLVEATQVKGLLDLLSPMISKPLSEGVNSSNQINTLFIESEFPPKTHRIALGRKHDGIVQSLRVSTSPIEFQGQSFFLQTYHHLSQNQQKDDFARLLKFVVIHANDAFAKMTDYSTDEIIGQTPRILQGE